MLDADAYQAQQRRAQINGSDRTFYCGAYWGMGGHEDGFRSGVDPAEQLLAKLQRLSRSAGQGQGGYAADMGNADQSQGG